MTAQPTPAQQVDPAIAAAVAEGVAMALPAALETYVSSNMFGIMLETEKVRKQLDACKVFVGVITEVKKEQSSTRGLITLNTGTTQASKVPGVPEGHEQVRTDRTDGGGSGRALALKARSLIGHRVTVWVEIEEFKNKDGHMSKMRVLRHLVDLGPAS